MDSLVCPKCRGAMRTYERSGITVDQCGDCRGIFLDRGELERLVDAEARFNAPRQQPLYEEKRYEEKTAPRLFSWGLRPSISRIWSALRSLWSQIERLLAGTSAMRAFANDS